MVYFHSTIKMMHGPVNITWEIFGYRYGHNELSIHLGGNHNKMRWDTCIKVGYLFWIGGWMEIFKMNEKRRNYGERDSKFKRKLNDISYSTWYLSYFYILWYTAKDIKITKYVMMYSTQPLILSWHKQALVDRKSRSVPSCKKVKVNQSHYRPEVPRVFQKVKVLWLRDNCPGWW